MIKTPQPFADFLAPDHCLMLLALGLTDQTKFYWSLDKNTQLACLKYKYCEMFETDPELENISKIPAYSIATIMFIFPDFIISKTPDASVQISIPPVPDTPHTEDAVYVHADSLPNALFMALSHILKHNIYCIKQLNLSLHEFNSNPYVSTNSNGNF